jgi:D-3-phosphoglycerate dehydrogenase
MPTVIITDHLFPSIEKERKILGEAAIRLKEIKPNCATEDDVIQSCADADALLVVFAPITRRVLESLPNVRAIVRYGIGVDNIDLQSAKDLGRNVANVPNFCLNEVAGHALAMMLMLGRRIMHDHNSIARGGWGVNPFRPITAFSEMTLGLVGFGAIARKVSEKAKPFLFRQIASDPFVPDATFAEYNVEKVSLDELWRSSDIISLHCPFSPATRHLICRETIAQMKPGVIIINTARGAVVKETDLIDGLTSGKIVGAGLDVFEVEPLPADSPLRRLQNVILTSHAASVSENATATLQIRAAESIRDFLQGRPPAGLLV